MKILNLRPQKVFNIAHNDWSRANSIINTFHKINLKEEKEKFKKLQKVIFKLYRMNINYRILCML
jgi:hypothetical protein